MLLVQRGTPENQMYPVIRLKTSRLICCVLALSLSLTSIAGGSMMTTMSFETGVQSKTTEVPCSHHVVESDSDSSIVSNAAATNMPGMEGTHSVDSHSGHAASCSMCALCTSLVPSLPVLIGYRAIVLCSALPEADGFVSTINTRPDKPPRP